MSSCTDDPCNSKVITYASINVGRLKFLHFIYQVVKCNYFDNPFCSVVIENVLFRTPDKHFDLTEKRHNCSFLSVNNHSYIWLFIVNSFSLTHNLPLCSLLKHF